MKRTLLRLVAILFAISLCLWYLLGGSSHDIDIQGSVVRQADGAPVPNARLLVTVYEYRFMEVIPPHLFTCIANQQGQFRIRATSPIQVDGLTIEASAPDNEYALDENPGRMVTLRVKPLGYNDDLAPQYRYATFRGQYGSLHGPIHKVRNAIDSTK